MLSKLILRVILYYVWNQKSYLYKYQFVIGVTPKYIFYISVQYAKTTCLLTISMNIQQISKMSFVALKNSI